MFGECMQYAYHVACNGSLLLDYKSDGAYKYYDIAVYRVSESGDKLKTTQETVYRCDVTMVSGKENMKLFKIEGIAAYNGDIFYIAVNQRNTADEDCDAIYHVNLT